MIASRDRSQITSLTTPLLGCTAALAGLLVALAAWSPALDERFAISTRSWLSPLCHQLATRCFWGPHGPHALCARCEGLYLGGALALALAAASTRVRLSAPRRWLLLALAPTAADIAARVLGAHGLDSPARFVVAIPAGFAAGALLVIGLVDLSLMLARGPASGRAVSLASPAGTLVENENG